MTPVIPSTASNAPLIPGIAFSIRRNNCATRCSSVRKWVKSTSSLNPCILPLSTSLKLFPQFSRGCILHDKSRIVQISATETDVVVEEQDSSVADEVSGGKSEAPTNTDDTTNDAPAKSEGSPPSAQQSQQRRARPSRKSEMPPIKNEELIPGATFTGKIRSIQPFGAFVDFGAFTDGLVHVSQLSDSFVKDVGNFVSIGQEVKVRLLEANTETGRISLTMRESDDGSKKQQQKDAPSSADKPQPSTKTSPKSGQKRDEVKKTSKFFKGQDLDGTVKNIIRPGSFISLPEGEEGFLPSSEESDDGFVNMMGGSSLQIGQEVKVRVLRVNRGQVTLTMKKEEDDKELDLQLTQGVVHTATNPFVLAFRKNKDIAAFLDQKEKVKKSEKADEKPVTLTTSEEAKEESDKSDAAPDVSEKVNQLTESVEAVTSIPLTMDEKAIEIAGKLDDDSADIKKDDEEMSSMSSKTSEAVVDEVQTEEKEAKGSSEMESMLSSTSEAIADEVKTEEKKAVNSAEAMSTSKAVVDEVHTEEETAKESSEAASTPSSKSEAVDIEIQTKEKDIEAGAEAESMLSSTSKSVVDEVQTEEKEGKQTDEAESMMSSTSEAVVDEAQTKEEEAEGSSEAEIKSLSTSEVVGEVQTEEKETDGTSETLVPKENEPTNNVIVEEVRPQDELESVTQLESSSDTSSQISSSKSQIGNGVVESESDAAVANAEELTKELVVEDELSAAAAVEGNSEKPSSDENESIKKSTEDTPSEEVKVEESKPIAESHPIDESPEEQSSSAKSEVQIPSVTGAEVPSAAEINDENGIPAAVGNGSVSSSNGKAPADSKTKASISPALVKQLREESGAGMMDCKKALAETGGDIVKAQEFLRKKGLASAEKKASRATAEGRIGSYIHDSRIGVLVEVNCETDFVSRGEIFKELVDDLAMQVAACPQVQYLVPEDVPDNFVSKEREIEMQKEDLLSKPEQIRSKIVEGRIKKRLDELALLEQPYIKNDKVVVKDFVKQTIATIGENIKVKRFVRFNLGEGLEKKSQDFAAEVAAQTAAKAPAPPKQTPAPAETTETVKKAPTVAVSAALVKQLREETGAGMMDCKKALSETGGDLEKAQEYLRKKGLSTADKKSSRLAAEGRIGSYIHDNRIGVLIEVNCETDFVGRSEKFKELVDDLAMQVVACPQVQFVSIEDIPEDIVKKEKELELQREDVQSKPENIREKIVDGRVRKRLGELALLEQPFIKDDSILVKDLVRQTVAALGENIKVRRFVKFTLGETNEDAN